MARLREYDEDAARAALVQTFLERGFADTSLSDLEAASGLNRRQLYNDFGDKKSLLLQAIDDFSGIAGRRFLAKLEHSDQGLAAIRATLNALVKAADSTEGRMGCLICNTSREPIAMESDVQLRLAEYFQRIERAYRAALARAKDRQELSAKDSVGSLSRYFFGIHVSLCVMARAQVSTAVLKDVSKEALRRIQN